MVIYGQPKSQFIEEALKNGIRPETERFFRARFDNAEEEHISTFRGQLTRDKMRILKSRVDEIVAEYESLTKGMLLTKEERDLSKEIFIANYLLKNVTYSNVQFAEGGNVFGAHSYSNSIYGALIYYDAVCTGVSEAVDCLNKVMGVESKKLLVSPRDPFGGGHAFNIVKIGGHWYELDVTAEIGLIPGHKVQGGKWKEKRFLIPYNEIHRRSCVPLVPDCDKLYPREKIQEMRSRLEQRGLNFDYGIENENLDRSNGSNNLHFRIIDIKTPSEIDLSYLIEQLRLAKQTNDASTIEHWQRAILSSDEEGRRHLAYIDYKLKESLTDVEKEHWDSILDSLVEVRIKNYEELKGPKKF